MKFDIAGYEVEVKAKLKHNEKFNKHDTMHLMNYISLCLYEALQYNKGKGLPESAEDRHGDWISIYRTLKSNGLYREIKET